MSEKVIIFDTEAYAGNFERDLVAYITGLVGDCNVGYEAAEVAKSELPLGALKWFDEHVEFIPDEHGCYRPANIAPTPGWYANGMGTHRRLKNPNTSPKYPAYLSVAMAVREWPPDEIMGIIVARAKMFCLQAEETIPFIGVRCIERVTTEAVVKRYE